MPRPSRWLPPLLVLAAAVGLWYAVSTVLLSPDRRFLFPPPHAVVREGYLDGGNRAELLAGLGQSAKTAALGLLTAAAAGIVLAVAMSQARWVERSLFPYLVVLQATPILALVPLFGFWFGYGTPTRVLVCALIALFPIVASTLFGLRSVAAAHHDLFTLHRAGRGARLWKLQLPAALPSLFTGLRISAGLSVLGAIVGDFFFRQGPSGIGVLIDRYQSRLQSEQLLAAVLLSSLFGLAVFWAFGALARRAVGAWHESAREPGAW
ncbi:ABC transporter permease [Streptomyces polyrhachis]|uniref:ABC transporter permease n=1 Tax=Streptomyces polyrhachis TaxID=1282885 RepID=A0ABW2GM94_9ACTN